MREPVDPAPNAIILKTKNSFGFSFSISGNYIKIEQLKKKMIFIPTLFRKL